MTTQHRDLVSQRQQFGGDGSVSTDEYSQPAEQSDRDQIQEPKTHGQ